MTSGIAAAREYDVPAAHGRTLHVHDAGHTSGAMVLCHHGTPGAGVISQDWHESALARGILLVAYDRPGYGGSTRHPGRSIVDAAGDSAAIADALGADRFRTWGVSGGGPHADPVAAMLGDRVIAACSLASVAPYGAEGLEFLSGMGTDNVAEFGAALAGAQELTGYLDHARVELLDATPQQIKGVLAAILPDVDKAVLTGDLANLLYEQFARGLVAGHDGWFDDDMAFVNDWGFDVTSIDVPVLLMQGEQDLMVPFAHGTWLSAQIPGVDARLKADDGHLTLIAQVDGVHEWLLRQG